MNNYSKEYKEREKNIQRLINSCVVNDINEFDRLKHNIESNSLLKCIIISLRHGNVDLTEYILSLNIDIDRDLIFKEYRISKIGTKGILKVLSIIGDKKKYPNLFKLRGRCIFNSIEYFKRKGKVNELFICFNMLSKPNRDREIEKILNNSSYNKKSLEMKEKIKSYMREDIINEILE